MVIIRYNYKIFLITYQFIIRLHVTVKHSIISFIIASLYQEAELNNIF